MPSKPFNPDYAASPGQVLEMHPKSNELSVAEFARRCDLPVEFVQEIISGETPLDRETALLFQRGFGSKAYIWLGIESEYRQKTGVQRGKAGQAESDVETFRLPPAKAVLRLGFRHRPGFLFQVKTVLQEHQKISHLMKFPIDQNGVAPTMHENFVSVN